MNIRIFFLLNPYRIKHLTHIHPPKHIIFKKKKNYPNPATTTTRTLSSHSTLAYARVCAITLLLLSLRTRRPRALGNAECGPSAHSPRPLEKQAHERGYSPRLFSFRYSRPRPLSFVRESARTVLKKRKAVNNVCPSVRRIIRAQIYMYVILLRHTVCERISRKSK